MIEQVKTAYRYLFVLGIAVAVLFMALRVPVLSSRADFSIYNTGWNGCSGIARDTYVTGSFLPTIDISSSTEDRVIHSSFVEYEGDIKPDRSSIVIIGPSLPFTDREGEYIHRFLTDGGMLLLADDVGSGNGLLSMLNTTTRISGWIMVDLSYMKQAEFSVATDISPHTLTRNVTSLLMNYPSTITPSARAGSLVNSSSASWLEIGERDYIRQDGEPTGPFPLFTVERYGKGLLMVLSEPSLLINQMRGKMDNDILADNLIGFLSAGRDTIIIDESHHDLTDPVRFMDSVTVDLGTEEKAVVLVIFILIFLLFESSIPRKALKGVGAFLERFFREEERKSRDIKSIKDNVMKRHPDWDRSVLERLINEIEAEA